jgi:ATP adenylyltransferase
VGNQFQILSDFLTNKMRMSHIYQPVMLMELLSNKGNASVEEIAKQLLIRDPSQIEYYSNITKQMPGKVLGTSHKLVTKEKEQYSLTGYSELSSKEVNKLVDLCQSKLDDYIES